MRCRGIGIVEGVSLAGSEYYQMSERVLPHPELLFKTQWFLINLQDSGPVFLSNALKTKKAPIFRFKKC